MTAPKLTAQQLKVLSYVSHGYSNAAIGTELFVSEDTVKTHVRKVMLALGATDRAHAVRIGFEEGLLVRAAYRRPRVVSQRGGRRRAS